MYYVKTLYLLHDNKYTRKQEITIKQVWKFLNFLTKQFRLLHKFFYESIKLKIYTL